MAKTTVEQTNNWGVTRVFGKRVVNLTRGASAHVYGQGDQPEFEFDYDNLPPFFSTTSNANYRFAPGAVVTNLVFHTQEAWIGGTNLQVKATASDGSSVNLGAAQVTANLATKGKAVLIDLGATGVSLPIGAGKDYYVFTVIATGAYTAGSARAIATVVNPQNADSKIKYNNH